MSTNKKRASLDKCKDEPRARLAESSFAGLRVWVVVVLIVGAGVLAYHNSFGGAFIFDDFSSIGENSSITKLWPPWQALSPPSGGEAVQNRPIVNFSLAINYALGGTDVWGYHATNLAVHLLAALTLFGIVRRTLRLPTVSEGLRENSTLLALATALIWMVHPLQTEAVTYIIQRTESLAGMFYLLSLYLVIRGMSSSRSLWWYIPAVISCALGMGSKEMMVTAPLIILLYDRVFVSRSFKEVFRRRGILYLALAATWGILLVLVSTGDRSSAGY